MASPNASESASASASDADAARPDPVPYGFFEVGWTDTPKGASATMYFVPVPSVTNDDEVQNIAYFPPEFFTGSREISELNVTEFCSVLNNAICYDNDLELDAEKGSEEDDSSDDDSSASTSASTIGSSDDSNDDEGSDDDGDSDSVYIDSIYDDEDDISSSASATGRREAEGHGLRPSWPSASASASVVGFDDGASDTDHGS